MKNRIVVYAVNLRPIYWKMLRMSVTSLRQHSPDISVRVVCFGRPSRAQVAWAKRLRLDLQVRPARPNSDGWLLKFLVLGEVKAKTVLSLDVDTYIQEPVEAFLDRYQQKHFYARQELAMGKTVKIGPVVFENRLRNKTFKLWTQDHDSSTTPIFNSGVMIWNQNAHQKFARRMDIFIDVVNRVRVTPMSKNAVSNPFFADEIAAAITIGACQGVSWGFLQKKDAPFYFEEKLGQVRVGRGLLHINSSLLHDFLVHRRLSRLSEKILFQRHQKAGLDPVSFKRRWKIS